MTRLTSLQSRASDVSEGPGWLAARTPQRISDRMRMLCGCVRHTAGKQQKMFPHNRSQRGVPRAANTRPRARDLARRLEMEIARRRPWRGPDATLRSTHDGARGTQRLFCAGDRVRCTCGRRTTWLSAAAAAAGIARHVAWPPALRRGGDVAECAARTWRRRGWRRRRRARGELACVARAAVCRDPCAG